MHAYPIAVFALGGMTLCVGFELFTSHQAIAAPPRPLGPSSPARGNRVAV
jgi:hypothetical protein